MNSRTCRSTASTPGAENKEGSPSVLLGVQWALVFLVTHVPQSDTVSGWRGDTGRWLQTPAHRPQRSGTLRLMEKKVSLTQLWMWAQDFVRLWDIGVYIHWCLSLWGLSGVIFIWLYFVNLNQPHICCVDVQWQIEHFWLFPHRFIHPGGKECLLYFLLLYVKEMLIIIIFFFFLLYYNSLTKRE